tara:strand:+ start:1358 stop:1723 length:366 start_codon:yes stop_codon:yes gene_type:complete
LSNRNRNAGHAYERKIRNELKQLGYTDVVTSRSESRNMDNMGVDLFGDSLPFHVQCKRSKQNLNSFDLIHRENAPNDKPIVIFHDKVVRRGTRFRSLGEFVTMDKQIFYDIISRLSDGKGV